MTIVEIVYKFISEKNDKYCDDCLSEVLNITPRQQINQLCHKLEQNGNVVRVKEQSVNCSKDKLINKIK